MSRRNQDRVGAPAQDAPTPPVSELENSQQNTGFSYVAPTEIVDLPSGGAFYSEGHPLHGKDTVEIKYMTAKEEDILTSKSLLARGLAVDRMLDSIIMDEGVNSSNLLLGDRNALLVAARITGYGNIYETQIKCPECGAKYIHSFDLNLIERKDSGDLESLNVFNREGLFYFTLPRTKVEVGFQALTTKDEKTLADMGDKKKKYGLGESTLTDLLKTIIVSINGDVDRTNIGSFVDNMPAIDSRILRKVYSKAVPDVDMTQDVTCTECGTVAKMEVPFTGDFFWPG